MAEKIGIIKTIKEFISLNNDVVTNATSEKVRIKAKGRIQGFEKAIEIVQGKSV